MGCVQSGVEGYFVPPVAEDESPDLLAAAVSVERLPLSARLLLARLRVLSACFLVVATYFVAVSALTGTYDHVGPAGISLLQAALVRRASARCAPPGDPRAPPRVPPLFLPYRQQRRRSWLGGADTAESATRGRPTDERGPSSSLMARVGGVAFASLLVLALLGYLTYVAFLCFSRLERWCLVVLLERRWEKVEALSSRFAAAEASSAPARRRAEERGDAPPGGLS